MRVRNYRMKVRKIILIVLGFFPPPLVSYQ